ncbi:hypothetical protein KCP70_03025 [Salmonella enterica subsp. enterica]|nr:hypothetical protein KCP70_03025 [Salmonella enterica subsp. enterica]
MRGTPPSHKYSCPGSRREEGLSGVRRAVKFVSTSMALICLNATSRSRAAFQVMRLADHRRRRAYLP